MINEFLISQPYSRRIENIFKNSVKFIHHEWIIKNVYNYVVFEEKVFD